MIIHYTLVSSISIIALLILGSIIRKSNLTTARIKRFFIITIIATILVIAAEVATTDFESIALSHRLPNIIGNVLGFSISPLIPLLIGYAISDDKKRGNIIFLVPAIINFVLSVFSIRYPLIFGVSPENTYFRGDLFWIYIVAYGASMVFLFAKTLEMVSHYQNKNRPVLFALFLFVFSVTAVQINAPQLHISWLCISFAICLYYTYCGELYCQVDGLTGLLGHLAYDNYVYKINGLPKSTILVFDIDDFKSINDNYGHQFGDYCLIAISSCIRDAFFKLGVCFRIGGDEFCVISTRANKADIQKAHHKFLVEIESIRKTEKRFPTVSIGCAYYDKKKGSIDEAIFAADQEMYYFKQRRKD